MFMPAKFSLISGAPVVIPPVTLDPATLSSGASLSADKLTLISSTNNNYRSARATTGRSSGKWYFEVQQTAFTAAGHDASFGVVNDLANLALSHWPGEAGSNSVGCFETFPVSTWNAAWWFNGARTSNEVSTNGWVLNSIMQVAVDIDARKIWQAFENSGTWLGSTNAGNPATGANGQAIPSGTIYPVVTCYLSTDQWRVYFTNCNYAPPSGFTPWQGS
jgi:hypothetical protein